MAAVVVVVIVLTLLVPSGNHCRSLQPCRNEQTNLQRTRPICCCCCFACLCCPSSQASLSLFVITKLRIYIPSLFFLSIHRLREAHRHWELRFCMCCAVEVATIKVAPGARSLARSFVRLLVWSLLKLVKRRGRSQRQFLVTFAVAVAAVVAAVDGKTAIVISLLLSLSPFFITRA